VVEIRRAYEADGRRNRPLTGIDDERLLTDATDAVEYIGGR
jgi:hypothetical protein